MTDQWIVHGGAVSHAMTRFPDAPKPWVDLSTGINPVPWPVGKAMAPDWTRLPEPDSLARLEAAAARHFGVEPQSVCATPGSELCLRLLPQAGVAAPFACLWPAYRTHVEALPNCQTGAAAELPRLARQPGTLLLANPNNPDGRLLTAEALLKLAREKRQAGGWLVVDEAFIDAHADSSIAPFVWGRAGAADDLPVLVLRSFGKFFGLPGLRLGFLVGPRRVVGQMRGLLGSWPVNDAAIRIGIAAYADHDWQADARVRLSRECSALDEVLMHHGLRPVGASPLFRLVEVNDLAGGALALFEHLARRGILTRPFSYNPRWLRLGLPANVEDYARLEAALTAWRKA